MNSLIVKASLITVCIASLTGCGASLFSFRDENPNIQDISVAPHFWPWSKTGLNTFATTASRRMVLTKQDDYGDKIIVCSEAPPDVGEAFASAVANGLKSSITEPKTQVTNEFLNNYARTIATQITPLVYRTQGLQFYRDAMHALCVDKMNWESNKSEQNNPKPHVLLPLPVTTTTTTTQTKTDKKTGEPVTTVKNESVTKYDTSTLNANNYEDMRAFYAIQAVEAIKAELPVMLEAQKIFFQNVKAGDAKLDIDSLKKIVGAVNPNAVAKDATAIPTAPQ